MAIKMIYFSPTGGTKKVVTTIGNAFGNKTEEIDFTLPGDYNIGFGQNDICIIGVPSFGGRVPTIARLRLEDMKGNNAYAVIVTTYGNREFDDTLLELKEIVTKSGFVPFGAVSAVTEHSIVSQFANGRPDEDDIAQLQQFAQQLRHKYGSGDLVSEVEVPGNKPFKQLGTTTKPSTDKTCRVCGECVKVCPVNAIPQDNPCKTNENCIGCMACVKACPNKSRKINGVIMKLIEAKLSKACSERKENKLY